MKRSFSWFPAYDYFPALEKRPSINGNLEIEILDTLSMKINFDLLLLCLLKDMNGINGNLIEQSSKAAIEENIIQNQRRR